MCLKVIVGGSEYIDTFEIIRIVWSRKWFFYYVRMKLLVTVNTDACVEHDATDA